MSEPVITNDDGAKLSTIYVERVVRVYALQEAEVDNLGTLGNVTAACFSFGSAFVSLGLGILTNRLFAEADQMTPEAMVATKFVVPGLFVIGAALLVLGVTFFLARRHTWRKIKEKIA